MYKIELTEQELTDLTGLMDAGVKATGLRSCEAAVVLVRKLQAAVDASQKATDNPVVEEVADNDPIMFTNGGADNKSKSKSATQ